MRLKFNQINGRFSEFVVIRQGEFRFFGSSIMDYQELRYTDHISIEKKVNKSDKLYYPWRLEL